MFRFRFRVLVLEAEGSLFAQGCLPMVRETRMIPESPRSASPVSVCLLGGGGKERSLFCEILRSHRPSVFTVWNHYGAYFFLIKMPGVRVRAPGGFCLVDLPRCVCVCV